MNGRDGCDVRPINSTGFRKAADMCQVMQPVKFSSVYSPLWVGRGLKTSKETTVNGHHVTGFSKAAYTC